MTEAMYEIPGQTQVVDTITYPVKSLRGASQPEGVTITENGLEDDRIFTLAGTAINDEGIAPRLTLREHPELAQIMTQYTPEGVVLRAQGIGKLLLPYGVEEGKPVSVKSWGGPVTGLHVSSEADEWLGGFLKRDNVQILAVPDRNRRTLAEEEQNEQAHEFTGRATDGYPLHVISLASLRRLNKVRIEKSLEPVSADHFRANIVIDGEYLAPFAEDSLHDLLVETESSVAKLISIRACERCVTVEANPVTGQKHGNVLRSIGSLHTERNISSKLAFGTWAAPDRSSVGSVIAPGQLVTSSTS